MGAWIETDMDAEAASNIQSHPTWVRGLKLTLETDIGTNGKSHPTWVRGLKQSIADKNAKVNASHPTWVRGLKLHQVLTLCACKIVAPYMGAWIETKEDSSGNSIWKSHPTWVRGLKQ